MDAPDSMHKPVLCNEVLTMFNPQKGGIYIDATVNGGGHAKAILEKVGKHGIVLGLDWDCELLERLRKENKKNSINNFPLFCANYRDLRFVAEKHNVSHIDGILFDLGFSSEQLEFSGRGFSFLRDEPLDMRYNPQWNGQNAEEIINTWPCGMIERILHEYGEERYARRIARGICDARGHQKISRTAILVDIIQRSVPKRYRYGTLHPATRTFQAFRIAVNRELENLAQALPDALALVSPGGKLAVISFHSLEDRIVKNFFRKCTQDGKGSLMTKKPLFPAREEIIGNPRARSARLRAFIKK